VISGKTIKGEAMPAELFVNRSLLPFLLWLALCAILAGIILEALDRLKQPRRIEPVAKAEIEWVDQAMDKVLAALEQDETLEWRAQYSLVEEAELVAEQHQARLESEREG
jgi:hypothetical protein